MTHRALRPLLTVPGLVRSVNLARRLGRRSGPLRIVGLNSAPIPIPRALLTIAIGGGIRTRTRVAPVARLLDLLGSDTIRKAFAFGVFV
eukprot:13175670-Alexandrium_andersonii.AAC.1